MKKPIIIIFALLFVSILSYGQDTLYMYKSGVVVEKKAIVDIDSIIFYKAALSGNQNSNLQKYLLTGNFSDIITYEIDAEKKSYSYINETSGMHNSGVYAPSTNANLNGINEITENGQVYSTIELPGKFYATSLPSGNLQNTFAFGITSDINLLTDYTANDIAGKFIWVDFDNMDEYEWGGFEILANGTFTWQNGPDDDNDFNENQHFSGGGSGTWEVSQSDPSRIIFTTVGFSLTGAVYPGKAFILENGSGQGFTVGVKYPSTPVSQSAIAGAYKWIDYTPEGYRGMGSLTLPASGTTFPTYSKYNNNPYSDSSSLTMTNFTRSAKINNAFSGQSVFESEVFYSSFLVLPAELILMSTWSDEDGIVSCGIGFKIED